jgi:hypothetical protein
LASTEAEAGSALADAEQRVNVCYVAVADAEKAGGNVTTLLSTLDDAGMLLSKAHLAFQVGDFDSAYDLGVQSEARLDGFDSQANSLKDSAAHQHYLDFMINVVGSAAGTVAVVVAGFAVWFLLKRKYKQTGEVAG